MKDNHEELLINYVQKNRKQAGLIFPPKFMSIIRWYGIQYLPWELIKKEFGVNNLKELIEFVRNTNNTYKIGQFASEHSKEQKYNSMYGYGHNVRKTNRRDKEENER
jgi:hypothetical protein